KTLTSLLAFGLIQNDLIMSKRFLKCLRNIAKSSTQKKAVTFFLIFISGSATAFLSINHKMPDYAIPYLNVTGQH
ncbi:MAG: hypothetical protein WC886_07435, partial [Saccharofermentanaceae bacterium]